MAIWTRGNATRYDRLASLANLVVLRRFDDLLCAGCALGKVAIRHCCLIPDCFVWLNTVSRTGHASQQVLFPQKAVKVRQLLANSIGGLAFAHTG